MKIKTEIIPNQILSHRQSVVPKKGEERMSFEVTPIHLRLMEEGVYRNFKQDLFC